jgi:hypothetical protein
MAAPNPSNSLEAQTANSIQFASQLGQSFVFGVLALGVALAALCNLGFVLGFPISPFQLPLGLALCLAALYWRCRNIIAPQSPLKLALAAFGLILALLAVGMFLAGQYYDMSYDGQCYHQSAILSLANGWNPLWEPYLPWHGYPVQNYPKVSWYLAASVQGLMGSVELGKTFNYLFPAAVGVALFQFLGRLGHAPRSVRLLVSIVGAATPTVLCQLNTFYLDGILVSLLTLTLIFSLEYYLFADKTRLFPMFMAALLLINYKYTGLVYLGVFQIAFWLALVWKKHTLHWAYFRYCAAGALLGALVLGFNPYVLNTVYFGSPVHPMPGENVARFQAPQEFIAKNRVSKLAWSLFARSSANMKSMPVIKVPFTVSAYEFEHLGTASVRYGGLGPWFGGVLLLLPLAVFLAWRGARPWAKAGLLLCGLILASALTIPETWFSRFVPQIWLLPVIWVVVLGWGVREKGRKAARTLAVAICLLLLVDQAIVLASNWAWWSDTNQVFARQAAQLKKAEQQNKVLVKGGWIAVKNRLESVGLDFEWVKEVNCPEPQRIAGTHSTHWYCLEPKTDGAKP